MVAATSKRVASYKKRRQEAQALQTQAKALEAQLSVLRRRLGAIDEADEALQSAEQQNEKLRVAIAAQQLVLASTQSLMLQCVEHQYGNPMLAHVHLPMDREKRREVVMKLKDEQFTRVRDYIRARGRHLDLSKPHFSEDRFQDADGASCCLRYEVVQFPCVRSVQQVFDALVFLMFNMEISISETLGDITVRDDYDASTDSDVKISNHRLISTDKSGVTVEMNMITFAQSFTADGQAPSAIVSAVSVAEDDLYPYKPLERVRKDLVAGIMLSEHRHKRKRTTSSFDEDEDEDEVVVVLQRAGLVRHPQPQFEVPIQVKKELEDGIIRWGDAMMAAIQKILYGASEIY